MNKNNTSVRRLFIFVLFASLIILYIGCNGGSSGGGDQNTNPEEAADVSGTWQIHEDINDSACVGEPHTSTDNYTITVTQSGKSITVTDEDGNHYSGTVNGSTLSWTGSIVEQTGTSTITSMSLTISGNTISGTANWNWNGLAGPCSGTTEVSGTRTSGGSTTGGWAGSWIVTEHDNADSCGGGEDDDIITLIITVNGSQITVDNTTDGEGPVTGTITGNTATLHDVTSEENEGTSTTDVTITISQDGKSITGTGKWSEVYPHNPEDNCNGSFTLTGTKQ